MSSYFISGQLKEIFAFQGPCSVIATCQGYILKHLMELPGIQFKDLTEDKCRKVLVQAICNILSNCKESTVFKIVTLDRSNDVNVEKAQEAEEEEEEAIDHQLVLNFNFIIFKLK